MQTLTVSLILFLIVRSTSSAFPDDLIVSLPNGQIRGHEIITDENFTFYGFQGIPYATPALGNLRFQAPVPAENWDGILNATQDKDDCINRAEDSNPQSEDCLYINVYTPSLITNASTNKLLPVMFWIFGGAFNSGSSAYTKYGPDKLVQDDIVFVSFNYRLGAFGFLSTGDLVIHGNAGLKDQNLALKWTRQNVHLFGGDPEKITIFGQSAGAASVMYHLLSEQSAGLFRAAIAESGTALIPPLFSPDPKDYAVSLLQQVAENNNITIDNSTLTSTQILDILNAQTTDSIAEAALQLPYPFIQLSLEAVPCLEEPHDGAFLLEPSFELLNSGKFNQVPTIMGLNSEEYLFFMGDIGNLTAEAKTYDNNLEKLLPYDLILDDATNKSEVAEAVKRIYLDSNQLFADNLGAVVKHGTDNMFARPIIKHAILQSNYTDLYFYQFAYSGNLVENPSYWYTINGTLGVVGHSEDLSYIFKRSTTDPAKISDQDRLVGKRLTKMWTNFAKYLNPTPEPSDLLQNVTWPRLESSGFQYLNISENLDVVQGYPRYNSFPLWDEIFSTFGVRPFNTY